MIPLKKPIDFKEVKRIVGLSRTTIYHLEKAGDFPKRSYFSKRAVRWEESEVRQWVANRMRNRVKPDNAIDANRLVSQNY